MKSFADIVKQSPKKDEIKKDKIVILKKQPEPKIKIVDVSYTKKINTIDKNDNIDDEYDNINMEDYIDIDGYNHYLKKYE